jgi:hypothetical protein
MKTFSQRKGITPVAETVQINSKIKYVPYRVAQRVTSKSAIAGAAAVPARGQV